MNPKDLPPENPAPERSELQDIRDQLNDAGKHSEEINRRLVKRFGDYLRLVRRQAAYDPEIEELSREIWAMLRTYAAQSYETYTALNDLMDDYQRYMSRLPTSRWSTRAYLSDSLVSESAMAPRMMFRKSWDSPRPRDFILQQLQRCGDAGMNSKDLQQRFLENFEGYSVNLDSLWATTVSRMLKAGDLIQTDRDDGRWYQVRPPFETK